LPRDLEEEDQGERDEREEGVDDAAENTPIRGGVEIALDHKWVTLVSPWPIVEIHSGWIRYSSGPLACVFPEWEGPTLVIGRKVVCSRTTRLVNVSWAYPLRI